MWRHDRGCERPLHCGHEPFCACAYAEGAEEQSHPHCHLLAGQSGVELGQTFSSFKFWRKSPVVFLCLQLSDTTDDSWYTRAGPDPLPLSSGSDFTDFLQVNPISFSLK